MLTAIAALVLAGPTTIDLIPTDDIWVYPRATDTHDIYLRAWGAEGKEVAKDVNEMDEFGYSYLKFDVSKVPARTVTSATLTVTHIANPGFDEAYSKQNPLHVRPVPEDFDEKTWDFSKADQVKPESGDKAVFGGGYAEEIPADKEFKIAIDLLKGPNDFRAYLSSARESQSHSLAIALTASVDVEDRGQACIYKFYSKDVETAAKRPV